MKTIIYGLMGCVMFINTLAAQGIDRKIISEVKVVFDVTVIDTTASNDVVKAVATAVRTVYVKNDKSRSEFVAPGYKQTTIYNAKSDTTVVLKEVGSARYISYIDKRNMKNDTIAYDGIRFVTTRDSKNILGYECKKVQAQLPNGTYFEVYYAPAIEASNKDFEQQFKELPGFILEYEAFLEDQKTRVKFTATSIDIKYRVPASLFAWPNKGYRVL